MKRLLLLLLPTLSFATAAPQALLGLRAKPTEPYLREHYAEYIPAGTGLSVIATVEHTPAAEVLRRGDIILSINGKPLSTVAEMKELVQHSKSGDVLQLKVLRLGDVIELSITLAARPEQPTLSREQQSEFYRLLLLLNPQDKTATVNVPEVRRQMLLLAQMGLADKDEYGTCVLYMATEKTLIRIKSTERSLTISNNHPEIPDAHLRADYYKRDDKRLPEELSDMLLRAEYYRP